MGLQIFHIFKEKRTRLVMIQDPGYFEEQISLFRILKAVLSAKRLKFGNTSKRERLTWKSCYQDVVSRDIVCGNTGNISIGEVPEIGCISLLGELIPFRAENSTRPSCFKADTAAADSCEKIDKCWSIQKAPCWGDDIVAVYMCESWISYLDVIIFESCFRLKPIVND